ncbi:Cytochrome P450 82A4 [Vitis vinifera]|uniref:Cytochrome P450 82A4 n=1 Tax=Vitis vinifera TaxID=29760 RepID=A0A438ERQ7_VITVI|nr:Cytochrome P450 82A4 [Vitis vinifera]
MYFLLQYLNITTVGVFATLFLSYCLLLWRSRAGNKKIAPEAAAAWPIIGHLHLLAGGSHQLPHITLGNMADKYGPVFTIRIGLHRAVVVSSWEMAKECSTANDQPLRAAEGRPSFRSGDIHKRAIQALGREKNESGLVSVEMKQWFGDLTLNVILRMVAGKRYFSASDASENKQAQRCRRVFREFFHLLGLFAVADAIPFLGWLDWGRHEKTLKKTAIEMDSIAQEWLEEHRRRKDSGDDNSAQDFMDVMQSVLDGKNLGGYDADTINKATCLTLISGGSDTTVVSLTWALSLY